MTKLGDRLPTSRILGNGVVLMPRWATIVLLVISVGITLLELSTLATDQATSWWALWLELAMTLVLPVFGAVPLAATSVLAVLVLVQPFAAEAGGSLMLAAAALGLVTYTCPIWATGAYAAVFLVSLGITTAQGDELTDLGSVSMLFIALVSALIGIGARRAHLRSAALAQRAMQVEAERAHAVAAERERITAELHDILAHDVTLIAMHARVLEAVDDPQTRRESLAVIKRSATRSLADIRRLVSTMQADQPADESELATDVRAALETAQAELESVGAQVSSQVTGVRDLAPAVAATLVRMIREATTNIIRHAGAAPQVSIRVERSDASLVAEIMNSIGVVDETLDESTHLGIERLSARVEALSGHLYSIRKGQRWTLRVVIPLF